MSYPEEVLNIRGAIETALKHAPPLLCVGLSGGEDSHVLLHALLTSPCRSDRVRPRVHVLHVNHGLRKESGWEEVFVRQLAAGYEIGISVHVAPEKPSGENVEAWARKQRYDFFAQYAAESEVPTLVCTGHHMEDQAETLLQRVLNGRLATYGGCIAMKSDSLLRPFLKVSKHDITAYRDYFGLSVVYDASNHDRARSRNRIRHELLPLVRREYNPQVVSALSATAERLAMDEAFIDQEVNRRLSELNWRIVAEELRSEAEALQWRLLRALAAKQLGPDARRLGYRAIGLFRQKLLTEESTRAFSLDLGFGIFGGVSASGSVTFGRCGSDTPAGLQAPGRGSAAVEMEIPGECIFDRGLCWLLTTEVLRGDEALGIETIRNGDDYSGLVSSSAACFFDADELKGRILSVRARASGDRMDVWRRGHRKVKKLLQEKGVALALRDSLPLVTLGEEILWVPGVARSNTASVKDSSSRIVKVSCVRKNARA